MSQPKVSVIFPHHNGEALLSNSVQSVLGQTYNNFELIVVDDASTDNSLEVARSFDDERVTVIGLPSNKHVANALNAALDQTTGTYIAIINTGDTWDPSKLEKQVAYMEENPEVGACFTRTHLIDTALNIIDDQHPAVLEMYNNQGEGYTQKDFAQHFLRKGNFICNPSALVRNSSWEQVGRYYQLGYVYGEDFELWFRLALKFPLAFLEEPLTNCFWEISETKISDIDKPTPIQNINNLVKQSVFELITDQECINLYSDLFVCPDSHTSEEIACEKALLLLGSDQLIYGEVNFIGLSVLSRLVQNPQCQALLENKYGFTLMDYYQKLGKKVFHNYNDANHRVLQDIEITKRDMRIQDLENQLRDSQTLAQERADRIRQLQDQVNGFEQSLSRKVTGPLRGVSSKLHRK